MKKNTKESIPLIPTNDEKKLSTTFSPISENAEEEGSRLPQGLANRLQLIEKNPSFLLNKKEICFYIVFQAIIGVTTIPFFLIPAINYVTHNDKSSFETIIIPFSCTIMNVLSNLYAADESWFGIKKIVNSDIIERKKKISHLVAASLLSLLPLISTLAITVTQVDNYYILLQILVYICNVVYSSPLNIFSSIQIIKNVNLKKSTTSQVQVSEKVSLLSDVILTNKSHNQEIKAENSLEIYDSQKSHAIKVKNTCLDATIIVVWIIGKCLSVISALIMGTMFIGFVCATNRIFENSLGPIASWIFASVVNSTLVYLGMLSGYKLVDGVFQNALFYLKNESFQIPFAIRVYPLITLLLISLGLFPGFYSHGFSSEIVSDSCPAPVAKTVVPLVEVSIRMFNIIYYSQFVFSAIKKYALYFGKSHIRHILFQSELLHELSEDTREMNALSQEEARGFLDHFSVQKKREGSYVEQVDGNVHEGRLEPSLASA